MVETGQELTLRESPGARQFLVLLRAQQYVKNIFVFAPLFFGLQLGNRELLWDTVLAFVAFSLAASGVYLLNDCLDVAEDRQHPSKKSRPIASGIISVRFANLKPFLQFGIAQETVKLVSSLRLVWDGYPLRSRRSLDPHARAFSGQFVLVYNWR